MKTHKLLTLCFFCSKTAYSVFFNKSIDIGATRSVFGGVAHMISTEYANHHNSFFISEVVYENTEESEKVEKSSGQYTEYNYVFTKLSENLDKEVNKG